MPRSRVKSCGYACFGLRNATAALLFQAEEIGIDCGNAWLGCTDTPARRPAIRPQAGYLHPPAVVCRARADHHAFERAMGLRLRFSDRADTRHRRRFRRDESGAPPALSAPAPAR